MNARSYPEDRIRLRDASLGAALRWRGVQAPVAAGRCSRIAARPHVGAGWALTLLLVMASAEADVVFSALKEGAWRLYRQTDPASAPRPIPAPGINGDQGAPRVSPAGTKVAFEVAGGGLHVCPVEGDDPCRSVALDQGYPVRPAWHPRTGALLFAHFTFKADEELSTLKRGDGNLEHIEPVIEQTGIQDFPDVSPDGERLAYTSWLTVMPYRGGVSVVQQIWTLDLGRGRAGQLLLSNASDIHPRWSPDGGRIAFSSNRTGRYEIWTVGADGNVPRQVTNGPGDKTWPAWSPDGTQILFTHIRDGRSGLSLLTVEDGETLPYEPFGPETGIQLKDADWRAGAD